MRRGKRALTAGPGVGCRLPHLLICQLILDVAGAVSRNTLGGFTTWSGLLQTWRLVPGAEYHTWNEQESCRERQTVSLCDLPLKFMWHRFTVASWLGQSQAHLGWKGNTTDATSWWRPARFHRDPPEWLGLCDHVSRLQSGTLLVEAGRIHQTQWMESQDFGTKHPEVLINFGDTGKFTMLSVTLLSHLKNWCFWGK